MKPQNTFAQGPISPPTLADRPTGSQGGGKCTGQHSVRHFQWQGRKRGNGPQRGVVGWAVSWMVGMLIPLGTLSNAIAQEGQAATSAADDFQSLFNGRDLTGWQVPESGYWKVQDGMIFLDRDGDGQEHNHVYLWTNEVYENFVLELEFKIPSRANSGVFLRTSDLMDPVDTGLEVQIANSSGQTGLSRTGTAGAVYDLQAPSANPVREPGQWNKLRIHCQGAELKVWLNQVAVIEMDLEQWKTAGQNPDGTPNKFSRPVKDFARRGYIGLQDHGLPIWYRAIRIKRLP